MTISWAGRLAAVGATTSEVASIQAAYDDSSTNVQQALDNLIEGIDNAGLSQMLSYWRTGAGPFGQGLPGGGLPFGSKAAILTGNVADDTMAISAGTGQKLSVSGGGGGSVPGGSDPADTSRVTAIYGGAFVARGEKLSFDDPRVGGVMNAGSGSDQAAHIQTFVNLVNAAAGGVGVFPPGVIYATPPSTPWTLGGASSTTNARIEGAGGGGNPDGGATQIIGLTDPASGGAPFTKPWFLVGGGSAGDWRLENLSLVSHITNGTSASGIIPSGNCGVEVQGNGHVWNVDFSNFAAAVRLNGDHLTLRRLSGSANGCGIFVPSNLPTQGDIELSVIQLSGKLSTFMLASSSKLTGMVATRVTGAGEPLYFYRYGDGGTNSQLALAGSQFINCGVESIWHGAYYDDQCGTSNAGTVDGNLFIPGWGGIYTAATTSNQVNSGSPITSIPVSALASAIAAGVVFLCTAAGYQAFVTTGAAQSATSIPVTSETPSITFPSGSAIIAQDANTWACSISGATCSAATATVTVPAGFWIPPHAPMLIVDPSGKIAAGTTVTSIASGSWPGTSYTLNLSSTPTGNPTGAIYLMMPLSAVMSTGLFTDNKFIGGYPGGGTAPFSVHLSNWFNNNTGETDASGIASAAVSGQPFVKLNSGLYGAQHASGSRFGSPDGTGGPSVAIAQPASAVAQYDVVEYVSSTNNPTLAVQPASGANKVAGVALRAGSSGAIEIVTSGDSVTVHNKTASSIASGALIKVDTTNTGGVTTASGLTDGQVLGRANATIAAGATGGALIWGAAGASGGGSGSGLPSNFTTQTANYTASVNDFVLANANGGGFNVTAPTATTAGQLFAVMKTDSTANVVTIVGTIDGQTNAALSSPNTVALLEWSGSDWKLVNPMGPTTVAYSSQLFTSSGTYNIPTGAATLRLTMVGGHGGGAGGGTNSAAAVQAGGGGGGAGMASRQIASVGTNTSLTITCGTGGTAGTAGAAGGNVGGNGGNGGATTVVGNGSGINLSVAGGSGGQGSLASSSSAAKGGAYGAIAAISNTTSIIATGGNSATAGGPPLDNASGGGAGGNASTTSAGGAGGGAGSPTAGGATGGGSAASGASGGAGAGGGSGVSGGPGGGGGGGTNNTGAGGAGGPGSPGWVLVEVIG